LSAVALQQSVIDVIPRIALPTRPSGAQITRFSYALPTVVLAHWIGIPQEHWHELIDEVLAFVRCVAPGGRAQEISAGIQAASQLEQRVRAQLSAPGPLLQQLDAEIARSGLPDGQGLLVANAIGLWFQACEGCAGLIGLSLLAAQLNRSRLAAADLVDAVLDDLPPIQNTRRFAAADVEIAGCPLHAGDMLVSVLATRRAGMVHNHAFGHGPHACPGARWARTLAIVGIEHVQQSGVTAQVLAHYTWRRSGNARVPEFY
jgi:cytochrome P450